MDDDRFTRIPRTEMGLKGGKTTTAACYSINVFSKRGITTPDSNLTIPTPLFHQTLPLADKSFIPAITTSTPQILYYASFPTGPLFLNTISSPLGQKGAKGIVAGRESQHTVSYSHRPIVNLIWWPSLDPPLDPVQACT